MVKNNFSYIYQYIILQIIFVWLTIDNHQLVWAYVHSTYQYQKIMSPPLVLCMFWAFSFIEPRRKQPVSRVGTTDHCFGLSLGCLSCLNAIEECTSLTMVTWYYWVSSIMVHHVPLSINIHNYFLIIWQRWMKHFLRKVKYFLLN